MGTALIGLLGVAVGASIKLLSDWFQRRHEMEKERAKWQLEEKTRLDQQRIVTYIMLLTLAQDTLSRNSAVDNRDQFREYLLTIDLISTQSVRDAAWALSERGSLLQGLEQSPREEIGDITDDRRQLMKLREAFIEAARLERGIG